MRKKVGFSVHVGIRGLICKEENRKKRIGRLEFKEMKTVLKRKEAERSY